MNTPSATQKKYALTLLNYLEIRTYPPQLIRYTYFPSVSL